LLTSVLVDKFKIYVFIILDQHKTGLMAFCNEPSYFEFPG